MAFAKGKSGNPNGRPRGSRNRVTREVRAAVLEALNADAGAVAFFRRLKNSRVAEDRRTFAMICARTMPREFDIEIEGDIESHVVVHLPWNARGPRPGQSAEEWEREQLAEKARAKGAGDAQTN